jgi:hypothetical protein
MIRTRTPKTFHVSLQGRISKLGILLTRVRLEGIIFHFLVTPCVQVRWGRKIIVLCIAF